MNGPDKMAVILLRGGGVRFRKYPLCDLHAVNIRDLYRFQLRTKVRLGREIGS